MVLIRLATVIFSSLTSSSIVFVTVVSDDLRNESFFWQFLSSFVCMKSSIQPSHIQRTFRARSFMVFQCMPRSPTQPQWNIPAQVPLQTTKQPASILWEHVRQTLSLSMAKSGNGHRRNVIFDRKYYTKNPRNIRVKRNKTVYWYALNNQRTQMNKQTYAQRIKPTYQQSI